jgi:glycine/D-amino acid oxidase-like deaminating enzyme
MHTTVYWLDTAPAPPASAELELPSQTDVAVIGGGYTGVSAARTLARHGIDVTVLEAQTLGWGASTRNGGFVLPGFKIGAGELLAKQGAVRARALFDAARDAVRFLEDLVASEAIDCEYARCGYVALAYKAGHYAELERSAALLSRTFAYETELVPRDRLQSEIASDVYYGGLLEPAGGIHPAKYFFGMAAAARRAGARLLEGVEVRQLRRTAGGFDLTTSRGKIRAREILVATNGYSGDVAPRLRRGVVPIGSYIIATAPLDTGVAAQLIPRRRVMSDTKNLLFYFRLTADNRLLFGGRASFTPTTTATSARILARGMTRVFPQLRGVPVDYSWSGKVGYTFDQLPHAGTMDGVHYAMGYCGHGVALATYLGARVGDAIAGKGDLVPFSDLRFPTMPFYRKRPWFLPLAGAWYRLADLLS